MHHLKLRGAAILFVLAAGCWPAVRAGERAVGRAREAAPQKQAARDEQVRLLRVPGGGIQPQAAVDDRGTLHLVYFEGNAGAGDLAYVRRAAGDESLSEPLRVNSQAGSAIATGSIRGAQIALGKGGRVHVVWNGSGKAGPKAPAGEGSPLLYARMNDDGSGFEAERNMIRSAWGLDGGSSVAADGSGNVYVAWHAGTGPEGDRRVWVAHSRDEGGTFEPEEAVDDGRNGACGCCGMKAMADGGGNVYLLYRSAREGVNRDMHVLTSSAGSGRFASNLISRWQVAVCPMSSAALAEGRSGVVAAWEADGRVFFSALDNERGALKATEPPGTGRTRKHPAIAVDSRGRTILAWTEGTGWERGGALAWQVFDSEGRPTRIKGRRDGVPVWSFAASVADPQGGFTIVY